MSEGCDCAELCSMGPTCPGGMLAGLPGSGCARVQMTDEECETLSDDAFWARLLGDDDPRAPGKDWAAAAFTEGPVEL